MTLTELRAALAEIGLRPSRALGQNFLIDANIARIILEQADVRRDETVLEIGPGLGALTAELLARAKHVVAIEKDPRLCAYLRERFPAVELLEADALSVPLPVCEKVVANLPYSISTPLLQRLVEQPRLPRRMVLMLQREVAGRLAAKPCSKQYGALTLFTQLRYQVTIAHVVSPRCFYPEPKVESAVVVLDRREPRVRLEPGAPFAEIVRAGFSQRRKMLGKLLARFGPVPEPLARRRAEQLSLEDWIRLANRLGGQPATRQRAVSR